MSRRPKLAPDHDPDLVRLYVEGQTLQQLAARYNIHFMTVRSRLRYLGVQLRPPGRRRSQPAVQPTPAQLAEMVRLRSVEEGCPNGRC